MGDKGREGKMVDRWRRRDRKTGDEGGDEREREGEEWKKEGEKGEE